MRIGITAWIGTTAWALAMAPAAHGEILDRVAVTVGNQVITESALDLDLRLTAFIDHKPVDITPEAKKQAAERLVDQILILREAAQSFVILPTAEEAMALVERVKRDYELSDGPGAYQAELIARGLTENDLVRHLLASLQTLRFSDLRFRSTTEVSEQDLQKAYDNLARQDRANGKQPPTFEQSRKDLEDLLTGDRAMSALDAWLEMAREDVRVEYHEEAFQ